MVLPVMVLGCHVFLFFSRASLMLIFGGSSGNCDLLATFWFFRGFNVISFKSNFFMALSTSLQKLYFPFMVRSPHMSNSVISTSMLIMWWEPFASRSLSSRTELNFPLKEITLCTSAGNSCFGHFSILTHSIFGCSSQYAPGFLFKMSVLCLSAQQIYLFNNVVNDCTHHISRFNFASFHVGDEIFVLQDKYIFWQSFRSSFNVTFQYYKWAIFV